MPKRTYLEAYASIRFFGPMLDPLDVTKVLGLPPDRQHRRGEPRLSRSTNGTVHRYADFAGGLWLMSSRAWVESPRLETHLEWLLGELEPRAGVIRDLLFDGVGADLFCYSAGSTHQPPSLPRVVRDRADALGLAIEVDHYQTA